VIDPELLQPILESVQEYLVEKRDNETKSLHLQKVLECIAKYFLGTPDEDKEAEGVELVKALVSRLEKEWMAKGMDTTVGPLLGTLASTKILNCSTARKAVQSLLASVPNSTFCRAHSQDNNVRFLQAVARDISNRSFKDEELQAMLGFVYAGQRQTAELTGLLTDLASSPDTAKLTKQRIQKRSRASLADALNVLVFQHHLRIESVGQGVRKRKRDGAGDDDDDEDAAASKIAKNVARAKKAYEALGPMERELLRETMEEEEAEAVVAEADEDKEEEDKEEADESADEQDDEEEVPLWVPRAARKQALEWKRGVTALSWVPAGKMAEARGWLLELLREEED